MRIGIFGNTNNYPYTLALGLRRVGVETVLAVDRREPLHRPEAKDPSLAASYPYWILDCSDVSEEDFVLESSRIGPVLITCGTGLQALFSTGSAHPCCTPRDCLRSPC